MNIRTERGVALHFLNNASPWRHQPLMLLSHSACEGPKLASEEADALRWITVTLSTESVMAQPTFESNWRPKGVASHLPVGEVLATTAHELRLPLSHIKGFVSSLRRTDVECDDQTRSDFLEEIELEVDRLTELIDSLLDPGAAVHRGEPANGRTFIHMQSLVHGALGRTTGLLKGRNLRLNVSPNVPSVCIDETQMERVLVNLIHNAIKYSPPGSSIGVSAQITAYGEVELSVDDQGAGVAAEDRNRIFEPFFRGRAACQSTVAGHGLGLAICRSIVQAHGGRMRVTNRRGGGARFSVFLPAQLTARECAGKPEVTEQAHGSAKHSRAGRLAAKAQAALSTNPKESGDAVRSTTDGGETLQTDRGAPVRPAAA